MFASQISSGKVLETTEPQFANYTDFAGEATSPLHLLVY